MGIELYEHQEKALAKLSNGKILWGGVGSGKTIVAVKYYMKVEADADVYVITTAKKRDSLDWQKEFARVAVGKHLNATVAGQLTIDSWNNIGKYRDVQNAFFIFDEQRLVGSGQWSSVFINIARRNRWILLSATPGDTWMDYIPIFVANGFYKNRSEFKRQHVVYSAYTKFPKVERYLDVRRLVEHRDAILVEMPFTRATTRHTKTIDVEYDRELFEQAVKHRWNPFENQPLKDVAELFRVMRQIVNSDGTRIETVSELMDRHPRLIVFYNFDYELEALRTLTSTTLTSTKSGGFKKNPGSIRNGSTGELERMSSFSSGSETILAEWNGHRHQVIPDVERWLYLVQYQAGAEGWNCTDTDAMCFYSLPYSWKLWEQAHGRIDRINTTFSDLWYYILLSNSAIDSMIMKCLEQKRSFNERKWVSSLP
jgi:hypothetical protein